MLFRKIKGVAIVFSICAIFALSATQIQNFSTNRVAAKNISYIIDAGHGIPDGGAVGTDGTTEQELNLSIALKLSEHLEKFGIYGLLTRSNENSIFEEGDTIHEKKVSDIKHRIKIADTHKNIPFVSIHMNTYPSNSVKGIQVFYSAQNEQSIELAQKMQTTLNEKFQNENPRVIKQIPNNIYLFSHIENPSIIIECGFISNAEELSLLKTDRYQEDLAKAIATVLANS